MEVGSFPSARHAAQDLTRAASFSLGPLTVDPPALRVGNGERSEKFEPRVMRVLVALGGAGGKVLSRDDLIDLCWDGTIVGDNAIKRVIFRLRHALDELSGGAVQLETITKVGFRLVYEHAAAATGSACRLSYRRQIQPAPAEPPFWAGKLTRRAAAGGVVAMGAGSALAYAGWNQPLPKTAGLSARELFDRGMLMRRSASPENGLAAISYFEQAVALDPTLADAWGALAISYGAAEARVPPSARVIGSAARRALGDRSPSARSPARDDSDRAGSGPLAGPRAASPGHHPAPSQPSVVLSACSACCSRMSGGSRKRSRFTATCWMSSRACRSAGPASP